MRGEKVRVEKSEREGQRDRVREKERENGREGEEKKVWLSQRDSLAAVFERA